ncbi:MAG: hypothetical protein Q7S55_03380 [Nanoarchaeota archaeon]|nr:hypothetical protein [Nanoarchaeota archaeon]
MRRKTSFVESIIVDKKEHTLTINGLIINDHDVVDFFADKEEKEQLLTKAIQIGVIGLRSIGTGASMGFVQSGFNDMIYKTKEIFADEFKQFSNKIDDTFDIDKKTSMVARLQERINELFDPKNGAVTKQLDESFKRIFDEKKKDSFISLLQAQLESYFGDKNGKVKKIIDATFDPDNKQSAIYKLMSELEEYLGVDGKFATTIEDTFDIEDKNTPLGKLSSQLEDYFDKEEGTLKQILDETFDVDKKTSVMGQFIKHLEDNFDVDKGNIKKLLDPSRENSPIQQLRKALEVHLEIIKQNVVKETAKAEEREKGTQKGGDFSDAVTLLLEEIARPYDDEVEETTTKMGTSGKKGDQAIYVEGDASKKIVVESKDDNTYANSKPKLLRELDDAMKNRNGKFGMFVFKKESQLPREFRPVKIMKDRIILSAENYNLYFAYRIARQVVLAKEQVGTIPLKEIQTILERIITHTGLLDQCCAAASKINTSADYIRTNAKKVRDDIEIELNEALRLLSPSPEQ